jgi:hypothetical protein
MEYGGLNCAAVFGLEPQMARKNSDNVAWIWNDIDDMNRGELQAYIAFHITGMKDAEAKENLEAYFEAMFADIASLFEIAYDIESGVYNA